VIPPVVAVLLWKTFYDASSTGVFNTILGWIHLGPYPWLQSQSTAMPSLVLESTWANAGGTVIIYLAALTGVNRELYEAASVDGAGAWMKFRDITLPILRPILLILTSLSIIWDFGVFTQPYLLIGQSKITSGNYLMSIYLFEEGYFKSDFGRGAAISILMLVMVAAMSIFYVRKMVKLGDVQ